KDRNRFTVAESAPLMEVGYAKTWLVECGGRSGLPRRGGGGGSRPGGGEAGARDGHARRSQVGRSSAGVREGDVLHRGLRRSRCERHLRRAPEDAGRLQDRASLASDRRA